MNIDEYVLQEQLDGYDAIEWLAAQPFCDGHVNQMGISYGGFTSLQVATHQPPHLTAIIPMYFTDDRYTDDCHYRGGHLRMYYDVGHYGNFMIAYNALPPYPEWSGGDWARDLGGAPRAQRAVSAQVARAADRRPLLADTARVAGHRRPDRVPCLHDRRLARRLPEPAAAALRDAAGAEEGARRTLEPRAARRRHPRPAHRLPARGRALARPLVQGRRHGHHGRAAGRGLHAALRAAGSATGSRPRANGAAESDWPPPGQASGTLTWLPARSVDAPGDDGADDFDYVPTVGVTGRPLVGRRSSSAFRATSGPTRPISLVYTSEPLRRIAVLGCRRAVLHVSSTAAVIGFAASLCDVAPDGTSHLVAKGC